MHPEAYEWVQQHARDGRVLDIGGRSVNGHVRDVFPGPYVCVDLRPGVNVDHVTDVTEWDTSDRFDVIVCCEVFEHTDRWRAIIDTARKLGNDGARFIITAAGPGREPHSGVDGDELRDGEWYENITPDALREALSGWRDVEVDQLGLDVRAVATK